jgi:phosphoglycolate phosphatase-like HAD superfamily hydrolase
MSPPSRNDPGRSDTGFRCLVLDFDGVVLESVDIKTDAFRELFQEYDDCVDSIVEYHLQNNGLSRFVKFEHIYRHFLGKPWDESERLRVGERFSSIVFRRVVECPFVPGAEEFLESYSTRLPLYVASASPHEELHRVIAARELGKFFKEVFGYPNSKRDVIRRALADCRVRNDQLLYIGDSVKDFEAARDESVFFVGRSNKENLEGLGAPLFEDLKGIGDWLELRWDRTVVVKDARSAGL